MTRYGLEPSVWFSEPRPVMDGEWVNLEHHMSWKSSRLALCAIGVLHTVFMLGELFEWSSPFIMNLVLGTWPPHPLVLSQDDIPFTVAVVHNAGIYNGIAAAGLFAAASLGPSGFPVQVALLAGGIVAGIFGAVTLAPVTIVQAILGAIALAWIVYKK
jgi:hypothetical protein